MGFKCGIVGLPNVGKSTLFNALTKAGIQAANYPFCTIEPNVGIVPVPDPRLNEISKQVKPEKVVATTIEFVDIAGLVAGASKGEGLGNQFLGNIRNTDAIAHVVRCFENDDVVHVSGKVNPLHDIEIINTELTLADLETVEKALNKVSKAAKTGSKEDIAKKVILDRFREHLNEAKPLRLLTMTEPEKQMLESLHLLTDKPVLYIANVAEDGFVNNPYLEEVKQIAHNEGAAIVAICASIEADMADLPDAEKQAFLADLGFKEPGLNRVIRAGYNLLHLVTFFTAGPKEVHAWTIPKGATAPQAAGKIHSDFEKGFIRAEVISYADFIEYGGEHSAKEAGRLRVEGRDYIVHDGDIMHFRFNV